MKPSPMPTRLLPVFAIVFLAFAGCTRSDSPSPSRDAAGEDDEALITYRCPSGRTVEASYPSDSTAVVQYDGRRYSMTIAVSASGARYVGDELEWWTKGSGPGSEGTIFRHERDGTSGDEVETCTQPRD